MRRPLVGKGTSVGFLGVVFQSPYHALSSDDIRYTFIWRDKISIKECFYDIIFLVCNVGTTKNAECNFLKSIPP